MMGNGPADITAVAALLARRWKEERPYFTLHEMSPGVGMNSWWVRRHDREGLELHWSRFTPAHPRHSCA
jgi:hypothetical protein